MVLKDQATRGSWMLYKNDMKPSMWSSLEWDQVVELCLVVAVSNECPCSERVAI